MRRPWLWLQLLIGWLPVWGLFLALISAAHDELTLWGATFVATRLVVTAAALGLLVAKVTRRFPWPTPVKLGFVLLHLACAIAYAVVWVMFNSLIQSAAWAAPVFFSSYLLMPFLILGVWLYVMTAGVLYASEATTRAARAEAAAAQSQLAALRGQLNPHFLFNALHTVVQLTSRAPDRAARAAEDIAGLLRTSLEETRDLVPLADEWRFVERYLDMERIRFGERLRVEAMLSPGSLEATVPSFALQTLVENAVRHGAAPKVDPTTLVVTTTIADDVLEVTVRDDGVGLADGAPRTAGTGTGLTRLRERLQVLYGSRASLTLSPGERGVSAVMRIPVEHGR